MDDRPIDQLARALATASPRRRLVRGLAGGTLAALLGRFRLEEAAAQEAARHFACRHVGKPCRTDDDCCSGRCRGRRGKRTCRAHHAGTCRRGQNVCKHGVAAACNGEARCFCFVTTGRGPFCGDVDGTFCEPCARDADCLALGYPSGSACVRIVGAGCGECPNGAACVPPC